MIISQHIALLTFDADRSTWDDLRHYPDTVVCRLLLRWADFAAANPAAAESAILCYEAPELSYRELAVARGLSLPTLRRQLERVELGDPGDYTQTELDFARPAWLHRQLERSEQHSLTYSNAKYLADFARSNPTRWRVLRAATSPGAKQDAIAEIAGVAQSTVSRYLSTYNLED